MNKQSMRVFHGLVNYGTQAGVFARELRHKGICAQSVTGYDKFHRLTDLTLKHSGRNVIEKILNFSINLFIKLRCFFKFNIFHFYFGRSLFAHHFDLPFYNIFGKKVVFHYLGVDVQQYGVSVSKYKTTNIKSYISDGNTHDEIISKRIEKEYRYSDLMVVCAPYISEFVNNSIVVPLAINLDQYQYHEMNPISKVLKIMHAPTSRGNKGTEYIIEAVGKLTNEGYDIDLMLIENVSHNNLKEKYKECDLFIDQILAGWYGTASIEAMAIGRPTICFIREEYFKYIDYGQNIPILNATPDTIFQVLKNAIDQKEKLPGIGRMSRDFVEKIHNSTKLADTLISLYEKM